jgi:hypothetical protein
MTTPKPPEFSVAVLKFLFVSAACLVSSVLLVPVLFAAVVAAVVQDLLSD